MKPEQVWSNSQTELQLKAVAADFGDAGIRAGSDLIGRCDQLSLSAKQTYEAPVRIARPLIDGMLAVGPSRQRAQACRALVAAAGLQLPDTLAKQGLPPSVQALLPAAIARLADSVSQASDVAYDETSDLYRKDLRFVVGQAVPCGAQDVDLFSTAPWTTLLKNPSLPKMGRYLAAGGWGIWFRIHTDPRNTGDFDEEGWRRCYKRIADLLDRRPAVCGMVGTSWFYDPQLLSISPRLAYLQNDPLGGGAFMLKNGPGVIHTQRATLTSPSRRKLYEEGKYVPVCWSVLWPRQELIAWARAQATASV